MKYLFIDMDNTIAENKTCDNIKFYPGLYMNKRPIQIVIDAIKILYPDSLYVIISQTDGGNEGEFEKHNWLDIHFPVTFDRLFIPKNTSKRYIIESYIADNSIKPEEVLLIDDKKDILQDCKQLNINVKYPQQIICDYELISRKVDD